VTPVVETAQEVLSTVETVVESAPEAPASAPEASPPVAPVVEPTPEASPPVEQSREVKEVPTVESVKEPTETSAGKPALEQGGETPSSSPAAAVQDAAPVGSLAAPEISSVPATTFPAVSGESQTSSAEAAALVRKMIAAQRAESFNRVLGGLGSSLTGRTDGLDGPSLLSASVALVADLSGRATSSVGAPAGARSGSSPAGSDPIGPPVRPTPSGSFGGAAGGGAGGALSGFPTFAGHLLHGAPLAMRRLRLSFQPWLTAFFVLIPERPG
jgi:hypothetical protein